MKFGKVDDPGIINLSLPCDHPSTKVLLQKNKLKNPLKVYVGCAKWNKTDLKGFYPRGTKDELAYYSTQFNSIELNATFYRIFPVDTFSGWYEKTPDNFRFFPKFFQGISHWKRLADCEEVLNEFILHVSNLNEKLEMPFVQLPNNFGPKNIERLELFFRMLPKDIKPAIELRHTNWFNDTIVENELYDILEKNEISNALQSFGFSIIDDKRSKLIERIKTLIVELVHQQNNDIKTNLSTYLTQHINHDYNYITNLFSEVTGTTIEKYFIAQKIERVKELLVYNELTLSEIAYQLNYSSVAHLSNQFKKVTGLTPSYFKGIKSIKRKSLDQV